MVYKYKYIFDILFPEYIEKKYFDILISKNNYDKKEIIKVLTKIKLLLYQNKYKHSISTKKILLIILKYNSELNIYDLDLFKEYISCPLKENNSIYLLTEKAKNEIKNSEKINIHIIDLLYDLEDKEIIEKYLKYFLLKDKNYLKDLNKYFKQDYINKFYAKIYFYSGNEDSSIMNLLTYNEINNIMNETILILNENNKEFFNINDNIELSLQIKNINNLYLKIYQINTENYYYTKKEEIDPYISLDGIIPFFEKAFTINSKPQILLNKKLKISKLKKNRGL